MSSSTDLTDVRKLLEEQLTEEMLKRLMAHAVRKANRLSWRGILGGPMPGGDEAKDVVINAIKKTWTGPGNWNPQEQPDLFLYLKGVVDSDINNLVNSWANRNLLLDLPDPSTQRQPAALVVASLAEDESRRDEERRSDEFFWGLYEYLKKEPDLQRILDCLFEGIVKPRKIASKLDVNAKEIYNARKRLRRRLEDYRKVRKSAEDVGEEASSA